MRLLVVSQQLKANASGFAGWFTYFSFIRAGASPLPASCRSTTTNQLIMEAQQDGPPNPASRTDAPPKVLGIGGIFFLVANPQQTKEWYAKNLGLEINDWGATFECGSASSPDEPNYLQWSPFKTGSDYFEPSKKEFMVNYRVQNIEGLVRQLQENGVTILDEIASYDYGKFVHIMDADGHKLELWEPC